MSVACSGQTRVVEQLGEKQDFETELSRRGFTHEQFALHVESAPGPDRAKMWNQDYEVRVTHAPTRSVKTYHGGPRENWVARFSRDLLIGFYGQPSARRVQPRVIQVRYR